MNASPLRSVMSTSLPALESRTCGKRGVGNPSAPRRRPGPGWVRFLPVFLPASGSQSGRAAVLRAGSFRGGASRLLLCRRSRGRVVGRGAPSACCRPHRVWGVHFWTGASGPPRGDCHTAGPAGPAGWRASELTGTASSPVGCVWPGPSQKSPAGRKPPRRAGRGPLAHVGLQKAPRPGPADSSRPAPQSRRSCAWTPTARSPPPACGCRSSAR